MSDKVLVCTQTDHNVAVSQVETNHLYDVNEKVFERLIELCFPFLPLN